MITESHKKGNRKWDAKNMATLGCKVKKEQADKFKAVAESQGKTANRLLKEYVLKSIETLEDEKSSTN